VAGGVNDKDKAEMEQRMHRDVLESDTYPLISFNSSNVKATPIGPSQYRVEITGPMTIHGVTNEQTISARVIIGSDRLRASGQFTLRQTDYAIELVSVAGGALKVKDELKVTFDVVAAAAAGSKDSAAA
jgi:polyisoprenoid-binding protein YceI